MPSFVCLAKQKDWLLNSFHNMDHRYIKMYDKHSEAPAIAIYTKAR